MVRTLTIPQSNERRATPLHCWPSGFHCSGRPFACVDFRLTRLRRSAAQGARRLPLLECAHDCCAGSDDGPTARLGRGATSAGTTAHRRRVRQVPTTLTDADMRGRSERRRTMRNKPLRGATRGSIHSVVHRRDGGPDHCVAQLRQQCQRSRRGATDGQETRERNTRTGG